MSNKVIELFERLNLLENDIRNSMVIYDKEIIMGINIVREFINELHPQDIDLEFQNGLILIINNYKRQLLSRMKLINRYTQYGIDKCLLIIDNIVYTNDHLHKLKKRKQ